MKGDGKIHTERIYMRGLHKDHKGWEDRHASNRMLVVALVGRNMS